MKLIVISSPAPLPDEIKLVIRLFENGMRNFQIHKPGLPKQALDNFIREIPDKYRKKTFLHDDFPKFHSLQELNEYEHKFRYAFLSPVFESISKKGYRQDFDLHQLKEAIKGRSIIALGGIDEDKVETCRNLGFAGVAVLGAIWEGRDAVGKFKKLKALCQKNDLMS